MKNVQEIKGVHDEDLPKLLQDLGLRDDFNDGRIRCAFSNEVVTMDNLLSIFSDGERIKFVCDNETAKAQWSELSHAEDA